MKRIRPVGGGESVGGEVARLIRFGGSPSRWTVKPRRRDKARWVGGEEYEEAPDPYVSNFDTFAYIVGALCKKGWTPKQIKAVLEDPAHVGGAWYRFAYPRSARKVKTWHRRYVESVASASTDGTPKRRRKRKPKEWTGVSETKKAEFLLWLWETGGQQARACYEWPDWRGSNSNGTVEEIKAWAIEHEFLVTERVHTGKRGRPPVVSRTTGSGIAWARKVLADHEAKVAKIEGIKRAKFETSRDRREWADKGFRGPKPPSVQFDDRTRQTVRPDTGEVVEEGGLSIEDFECLLPGWQQEDPSPVSRVDIDELNALLDG